MAKLQPISAVTWFPWSTLRRACGSWQWSVPASRNGGQEPGHPPPTHFQMSQMGTRSVRDVWHHEGSPPRQEMPAAASDAIAVPRAVATPVSLLRLFIIFAWQTKQEKVPFPKSLLNLDTQGQRNGALFSPKELIQALAAWASDFRHLRATLKTLNTF